MGNGSFNVSSSAARSAIRQSAGVSAFKHEEKVRAGKAHALHPTLDLTRKPQRESRDVPGKQPSTPVGIVIDQTGSMGTVAQHIIDDSHRMMKVILGGERVTDPQICTGAVGDAGMNERAPVQMGEFEANDELFEAHLSNIFREGMGGGNDVESYDLFAWFYANWVETDAWDKRQKKGFLFFIGDEGLYPFVNKTLVKNYIGIDIERDIPIKEVFDKLLERWEVFCLRPGGTGCYSDASIQLSWEKMLPPERVIKVPDWHGIVPLVAGTVELLSGASVTEIHDSLKESGFEKTVLSDVIRSLNRVAAGLPSVATANTTTIHEEDEDSAVVRL